MQQGHSAKQTLNNKAKRAPEFLKSNGCMNRSRTFTGICARLQAFSASTTGNSHRAKAVSALHVQSVGRKFSQRFWFLVPGAMFLSMLQYLGYRQFLISIVSWNNYFLNKLLNLKFFFKFKVKFKVFSFIFYFSLIKLNLFLKGSVSIHKKREIKNFYR